MSDGSNLDLELDKDLFPNLLNLLEKISRQMFSLPHETPKIYLKDRLEGEIWMYLFAYKCVLDQYADQTHCLIEGTALFEESKLKYRAVIKLRFMKSALDHARINLTGQLPISSQ